MSLRRGVIVNMRTSTKMRIITLSWESKLLQVSKEFVAYAALNFWKVCLMSCSFSSISQRPETGM